MKWLIVGMLTALLLGGLFGFYLRGCPVSEECVECEVCPLASSYCGEVDDICPEELSSFCELMEGDVCAECPVLEECEFVEGPECSELVCPECVCEKRAELEVERDKVSCTFRCPRDYKHCVIEYDGGFHGELKPGYKRRVSGVEDCKLFGIK